MFDREEFLALSKEAYDLTIVPESMHDDIEPGLTAQGKPRFCLYYSKDMGAFAKSAANIINLINDKDILEKKHSKMRQDADQTLLYDQLTGCFNRQQLNFFLDKTFAACKRTNGKFAVLLVNIDNFKSLNNLYGFKQGDLMVQSITQRLTHRLRDSDILARTGGDEFAVLLPQISEANDAGMIAQSILETLSQPYHVNNQYIDLSISIGIACYPNASNSVTDFLKYADIALTKAQEKSRGKNTFHFYTEQLNTAYCAKTKIELSLREAIVDKKLYLNFQPQIDVKTKKIIGLEALSRWTHPELGFVSPEIFIPIAEKLALIDEIGYWVIEQSCLFYKKWSKKYQLDPSFLMAVNVSPHQLKSEKFAEKALQIMHDLGVSPSVIEFELTESSFDEKDEERMIEILQTLKTAGIHLSIDDYGTGYSSLGRLCSFPMDRLKIDKSFVWQIGNDKAFERVIESTVNLAKGLNLQVVAEGVETQEHLDFLFDIECDFIQGYFFHKPLLPADIDALFEKTQTYHPKVI